MTSEKEKCHLGTLYDANNDAELIAERRTCKLIRHEYNHILPTDCLLYTSPSPRDRG